VGWIQWQDKGEMKSKAPCVHVVFKTHLDIGFTDYAKRVVDQYFNQYIPQALKLADELRKNGSAHRFIWTTGSWIIYEYLEKAKPAAQRSMERGILNGDLSWHALPFTTHTELMDRSLFKAGLSLSARLDKRFGVKTVAAKMTDVPGHCRAIVPLLAEAGVTFLHIGINPASRPVSVPPFFRWQAPDGADIIVNYNSGYGTPGVVDGFDDRLYFAHTGDNCGPPDADAIGQVFSTLENSFPDKLVRASTLNNYAIRLSKHKDKLPVIRGEMGDSWIHGVGSDPLKVAQFRELCRLRNQWEQEYSSGTEPIRSELDRFAQTLLLIPEHTWGMDEKTHLKDYLNYAKEDFEAARQRNVVTPKAGRNDFGTFNIENRADTGDDNSPPTSYQAFEQSWAEQRDYLNKSLDMLKTPSLRHVADSALENLVPKPNSLESFTRFTPDRELESNFFRVRFDRQSGGIVSLTDKQSGRQWCSPNGAIGRFVYEIFSAESYQRFYKCYCINREETGFWSRPDFTKPGLEMVTGLDHQLIHPSPMDYYMKETESGTDVLVLHEPPRCATDRFGIPETISIRIGFPKNRKRIDFELQWFDKSACRLPEALWMQFQLNTESSEGWFLDKMGEPISPYEVLEGGNRSLHAIQDGAGYCGTDGSFLIRSPDAPLISVGRPRILEAPGDLPDLGEGVAFNLLNNLWGTNFPMWYEDDAKFRFCIEITHSSPYSSTAHSSTENRW
jgi:hypothetical protein